MGELGALHFGLQNGEALFPHLRGGSQFPQSTLVATQHKNTDRDEGDIFQSRAMFIWNVWKMVQEIYIVCT